VPDPTACSVYVIDGGQAPPQCTAPGATTPGLPTHLKHLCPTLCGTCQNNGDGEDSSASASSNSGDDDSKVDASTGLSTTALAGIIAGVVVLLVAGVVLVVVLVVGRGSANGDLAAAGSVNAHVNPMYEQAPGNGGAGMSPSYQQQHASNETAYASVDNSGNGYLDVLGDGDSDDMDC